MVQVYINKQQQQNKHSNSMHFFIIIICACTLFVSEFANTPTRQYTHCVFLHFHIRKLTQQDKKMLKKHC